MTVCPVGGDRIAFVAGPGEPAITLRSLADGSQRGSLARPPGEDRWYRLTPSPDGRWIAAATANAVGVWSVDSGQTRRFGYRCSI